MDIVGLVIGILGIIGTVIFGLRSKKVSDAFTRYVDLENEVKHLQASSNNYSVKMQELEELKSNIYRHFYEPKSKAFTPGDRVKLVQIPKSRGWITHNSKIGMTGVVVDYGPGTWEYTVYWSEADYEGEPVDDVPNRNQLFYVNRDQIERIV